MSLSHYISALHIVLTSRCNLSCAYCYQNDKHSERMNWEVLKACLDFGMKQGGSQIEFIFSGGEPLLEENQIFKSVEYVTRQGTPDQRVKFSLLTNGILLDEINLDELASGDFEIQISFDGISELQNQRSPGSFQELDGRLDHLRDHYPDYFRRRCSIAAVVRPDSFSLVPKSVAYFLEKKVPRVLLAPDFASPYPWQKMDIIRLERVFAEICDLSLEHHERTGEIPVQMFGSPLPVHSEPVAGRSLCGIMRGEKPAVDPSGEVFGCGSVVESYQNIPSVKVGDCLRRVRLGHITDPALAERLGDYRSVVRPVALFDDKQENYSTYGRCTDCSYLAHCGICPVSIGYLPDNEDINRIPDFLCAYNQVTLAQRERFWSRKRSLEGGIL